MQQNPKAKAIIYKSTDKVHTNTSNINSFPIKIISQHIEILHEHPPSLVSLDLPLKYSNLHLSSAVLLVINHHFCFAIPAHHVKVVHYRNHRQRAQEHEHGPEDPQHQRHRSVEQPVPDAVQDPPLLQEVHHVARRHEGGSGASWGRRVVSVEAGGRGGVDEEVDLVDEADGEGVAEEGEEEDDEDGDVLESHHELSVGPKHGVSEGLLHAVGAADDGCQAAAEEDGGGGHQGRPHDHVPSRLDGQDALLLIVLCMNMKYNKIVLFKILN